MIKKLLLTAVLLTIIAVGVSFYLSPDDLAECQSPGSGPCRPADAIVVISGGDTNARTDEAIKLYKNGWAPLIVFSGAAADKSGPSNATVMRDRALVQGVPLGAAVIEDRSETTKQNAEKVTTVLEERGVTDVILVTSSYHMRRAKLEFSAHTTATIRSHPTARDWNALWWLTPWGWVTAAGEMVKIGLFYIGGSR